MQPNSEYSLLERKSASALVMDYQRRRIYARFLSETGAVAGDSILDVGVSAEEAYESSNPLEAWYPHPERITALCVEDPSPLSLRYPATEFVQGDGRDLPFPDRAFDIVHSSAVLEHVGSADNQRRFIGEAARVARKAFFLTTPNRWFPVELHTALPLAHWLPKPWFRSLLRTMGQPELAEEANLNLVGPGQLRALAERAAGVCERFEISVCSVGLAGWPANLLLVGRARGR